MVTKCPSVSHTKPDPEPALILVSAVMKTTDSTLVSYRFARCSACAATIAAGVSSSVMGCGRASPSDLYFGCSVKATEVVVTAVAVGTISFDVIVLSDDESAVSLTFGEILA